MQSNKTFYLFLYFGLFNTVNINAQLSSRIFFKPSDSLNHTRILLAGAFTFSTYSTFSIGLYHAWYKKHDLTKFHNFNDFGEWQQMDKLGHLFNGYFQSDLCYNGALWTGINRKKSLWIGIGISQLFQTTIELFDGHSMDWGFSWPDIAANLVGSTFFLGQDLLWHKQKILLKFSTFPTKYSQNPVVRERVKEIYGTHLLEKLLKDYNAQTYWLSFNPNLFAAKLPWPQFLNFSIGYGSSGLYGAYENAWIDNQGHYINLDVQSNPRLHQYYFSFDLDLRKIHVKNHFLKTSLKILNIIKFPSPTLELNSKGVLKGHWLYF